MSTTEQVEEWNRRYPVGIEVKVKRDDGKSFSTTTKSEAYVMGHYAVIWVEGISGFYLLSRCTPL